MSGPDDPAAVSAQYAGPERFDARVRLYRLYARARPTWLGWCWQQLALSPGERVAEVGTGTGNLWLENARAMPQGLAPLLSDRSAGMLHAARQRLRPFAARFHFQRADVQHLPWREAAFDVVIANHMLYHVPDRPRAIAQLARVLSPSGRCLVGTNDRGHLRELRELLADFEVESSLGSASAHRVFDLERAERELGAAFDEVRIARRRERLEVRDASVVGDYLRSIATESPANRARIARARSHVSERIRVEGCFEVTVAAGVCVARLPRPPARGRPAGRPAPTR